MNYIFSFSSRNGAMRFRDAVCAYGVRATLVNTPSPDGHGCGLSVKCDDYNLCSGIINRGNYPTLRNVYAFDGERYRTLYGGGNE